MGVMWGVGVWAWCGRVGVVWVWAWCRRANLAERIDSTAIPESLVASLRAEFTKFVGADGHIRVGEIGGVMAAMGYSPSTRWLRSVITEARRTHAHTHARARARARTHTHTHTHTHTDVCRM
jgi:hypothetical protein